LGKKHFNKNVFAFWESYSKASILKWEGGGGGFRSENWWQLNAYSLNCDEGKCNRVKLLFAGG
jgi:hypothetical protein